ncbi:hypothetical protein [Empedobacter brevis]|uniref:hypothetical protein n=1 Tax=Empedobacter brevis TaxID=247 RepID=UPI0028AA6D71|nr:hypothetical protein [Empedobacter brevis]
MKFKIVWLFVCICIQLNAQTKLDAAIKNLEENYSQEKIYILFNKESYIAGETIWFKAFILNGYKPSSISTNLFVELYDKDKKKIDKKLLPVFKGQSDGSFSLKDDLQEDIYFLRAYTTYMTSFSEDFQYIQPIAIYNPTSTLKLTKNDEIKWRASIHPESGTFIENQTTKFTVRLRTIGELPKKWSGVIFEKNNPVNKILTFNSLDENVASFYLKAQPNKSYQLQLNDETGYQQIVDLPFAKKEGVLFKVIHHGEIAYQLKSINRQKKLLHYKIVGTVNHKVVYKATIKKDIEVISQTISAESLQKNKGILNLSVFDENDHLIAQRLVNNFADQSIAIPTPELIFDTNKNPREINTIELKSKESIPYTVRINNSKKNLSDNLLSALYLTSDFNDKISNPAQYLEHSNSEALDALLISEEFKKMNWNNAFNINRQQKKNTNHYLSYKGKAILNNEPLTNTTLNLFTESPNNEKQLFQVETDANGNFELNNLISYNPVTIYYYRNTKQSKSKNDDYLNLSFVPIDNFSPLKKGLTPTQYYLVERKSEQNLDTEKQVVEQQKINKIVNDKSIRLKEVIVRAEKESNTKKLNDELSSGIFKNNFHETVLDFIHGDYNVMSYTNIIDFLTGRVAGLTVQYQRGVPTPIIRNTIANVYLDERLIDASTLAGINPNDIAMVKIYKGGIIGYAIAVYLKKGHTRAASTISSPKNSINLTGYDKPAPFLSNDEYETLYKDIPNDKRETLYWNPNLLNQSNIEYFNNDNPKGYTLTILGFDEEGNPLYYEEKIN